MLKAIVNSPVRSGDQTIVNGDLIVGTAGEGINFTANTPAAGMTSQLLNWHEEGTWTPAFASTGLTVTMDIQNGKYVRNGSLVTVSGYIHVTGTSGTTTNPLVISGLPFASSGGTEYGSSGVFGVQQFSGAIPSAFMTAGSSNITLYAQGTITPLLGSNLVAGYYLFTIQYMV